MTWPPEGAELACEFTVLGEPKPAGSKRSGVVTRAGPDGQRVPVRRPGGGFQTFTKDSSGESGEAWRTDVQAAARAALEPIDLLDGPLVIEATFYRERPKGHFGTGRNADVLKDSAPGYPHEGRLADGTKLLRAVEDALNSVVIADDRRFVDARWSRRFGRPRAEVRIWSLPLHGGPRVAAGQESLLGSTSAGNPVTLEAGLPEQEVA